MDFDVACALRGSDLEAKQFDEAVEKQKGEERAQHPEGSEKNPLDAENMTMMLKFGGGA